MRINRELNSLLAQKAMATGVVMEGRFVLTAGHNLCNAGYPWGKVTSIGVTAGQCEVSGRAPDVVVTGGEVTPGKISPDGIWTVSPSFQWSPSSRRNPQASLAMIPFDYGFIDSGVNLGSSGFRLGLPGGAAPRVGEVVKVAGFPGETKRVKGASGERLFEGEGRVLEVSGPLFRYDLVTAKGLSGAPVWVVREGQKYLVGIHVGSDFAGQKGAVARRVDRRFLQDWRRWKRLRERS